MNQVSTENIEFKVAYNLNEENEPQSEAGLRVSEEVYWENYYERSDFHYEWNNGILEEKPVSDKLTYLMYDWLYILLTHFLTTFSIGEKIGLETGFRLSLSGKVTIRKPDLGVVLSDNPIIYKDKDRSYKGICDVCIEAISDSRPSEIKRDTVTKKKEYELAGVKEYYILDGNGTQTAFYYLSDRGFFEPIQPDEEGVIHSTALPGFRFRVAHLYEKPDFESLIDDAVYKDFVYPSLQAEKARAEQAEAQAAQEKAAREQAEAQAAQEKTAREQAEAQIAQEKARADRLAAKLKALGISED